MPPSYSRILTLLSTALHSIQQLGKPFKQLLIYGHQSVDLFMVFSCRQILYTVWRRSNESEILAYNLATHTTTSLLGDVFQPRGLHVDVAGDSLYWIDNPPGIYFNVGRVDLRGLNGQTADRTVLLKDQNQHPFALTLACSNLLWTDLMNKALWEWSPELKTYKQLMSFNNTAPHGLARLANPTCPPPNEMTTTQYPHSMLPSPEESSVEDIAPPPSTTIGENGVNHHQVSNISSCEVEEERVCLNGAACFKIHDQLHCLWVYFSILSYADG